jgi:NADPH:quinone reductase-like Zn-dependent oxidoreductase
LFALLFDEYGEPDVLKIGDAKEPHAGPGLVRIAVRAASVNPFDWKVRAGYMVGIIPVTFPAIPGMDAAGVVDEVGEGVEGVAVGDEVFGLGSSTSAEYAVLTHVARKPASMSFEQAAAIGLATETAARALDALGLTPGQTVLLDGAAGGVGSAATQLAVHRGLQVIGTGSPARHDYLRSLGAAVTTYGPGLAARVAQLAPSGVDAAVDVAGMGSVPELVEITGDPAKVISVADFTAGQHGVRVADGSGVRATYALAQAAELFDAGRYTVTLQRVFPLAEGGQAHGLSQTGHVQGKLVLTVP